MLVRTTLAVLLAVAQPFASPGPTRVLGLDGRPVNPLTSAASHTATVLVFTTTDCPISNRYAPEIQRLASRFDASGVRFLLVYPVGTDTPEIVRAHVKRFGYSLQAVRDSAQELVKHTGVSVTPEVAVLDRGARLVYRGRIDDRYIDLGRDRPQPTAHDLERALDAVVAGRPVTVRETRAVGCILADLVK